MPIDSPVNVAQPGDSELATQRKSELLSYVQNFYRRSWDWRSTKFHDNWDKWDRNYHGIYDPERDAEKESWQARMFVDITIQNVEVICSQLFKTMMAPKPPIQVEAGPDGDDLQARLIQDLIDYEMGKAGFDVNFYDALKEAVRYGSGFMKFFWERVEDTRQRRVPVVESASERIARMPPAAMNGQMPMPPAGIKGFQMQDVPVLLKNNLAARYVHIRDIFPEPNTTAWDKIIHRDKITYGTIVKHVQRGEFFDVRGQLENVTEGEKFEQDMLTIKQEQGYFDVQRILSKFEKKHTVWELWAPIPRKWINFDLPEGDQAEELVPAKVMVASGVALLASEENKRFDGEVPILKIDYIRTGNTYGKGIPEIIQGDQEELNEHVSLGIDNLNLIMNKGLAVIENALVNAEQDLVSKPGMVIRLKSQVVQDASKAVMPIEFPDIASSYFKHRFEIERSVQEKTGASRVTLGSSGEVRDTNQTLGGMELLKQMFNERIAAYGMVIESSFLLRAAQKIFGICYQELTENDLKPILGDTPVLIAMVPNPDPNLPPMPVHVPRYKAFVFPPPEVVNMSYRFKPMGIFSLENKIVKSAQIMDLTKLATMSDPARFDSMAALKYNAVIVQGISEAEKWFREVPMVPVTAIPPEVLPMVMENLHGGGGGNGTPNSNLKKAPGMKGGPSGNGPSFLPKNPIRREPTA